MPEHKSGEGSRFTGKYGVTRLVWYEEHFDIRDAIQREKSLKRWRRDWKIALIESMGGTVSRYGLVATTRSDPRSRFRGPQRPPSTSSSSADRSEAKGEPGIHA